MTGAVTEATSGPQAGPAGQAAFEPGWWARGLQLAERVELAGRPSRPPEEDERMARARRRLDRWRNEHRLAETGQFDRRLAAVGLDAETLLTLLAEDPAGLAARARKPNWAELAERAVHALPADRTAPDRPAEDDAVAHAGFSVLVSPFTQHAAERLDLAMAGAGGVDGAGLVDGLLDADQLRTGFVRQLNHALGRLAARTLILELNVLRVTDRLAGDTPADRFWSFVDHFARPDRLAGLLTEYPVLARLLAQASTQAVSVWTELLIRLATDRAAIGRELFAGGVPDRLVEANFGGGDQHDGGRSVALLRFAGGARLVYKPRPLAVHVHFNQAVDWLNATLPGLDVRTLRVLDRGEYGWVEFVEHLPCPTGDAVAGYYRRQGALLALLHTLNASDFHYENLIACADQPVLVDLETMFHPTVPIGGGAELIRRDPAAGALERAVVRVGLLPTMIWGDDGSAADMSGVGGDAGRRLPFKVVNWAAAGTDQMHVVRLQPEFPGSQNRPRLAGTDVDADVDATVDTGVDPAAHTGDLLDGFRNAYRAIAGHRDAFTGQGGLLARFAGDTIRAVVRATRTYGTLLHESTHPDVLRDALDRDRIFDHLWALSVDDPLRERLVEYERADLWAGDIPMFTSRPDTTDLWTCRLSRLPDLLDTPGLTRATGTLDAMDDAELAVQEWVIQASMATRPDQLPGPGHEQGHGRGHVHGRSTPAAPRPAPQPAADASGPDPDRLLAAARAIADRLADLAYRDGQRVNWLGLELVDESRWRVQPLRGDLYNGFPGVALFLGQLAGLTGEQRYAELARNALGGVAMFLDGVAELPFGQRSELLGCGGFGGPAGLAYVLAQLSVTLDDAELAGWLAQVVELLAGTVEHDEVLDVIGGSAGCLAAMLAVASTTGTAGALDVALACADRLVDRAEPQAHGLAWRTTMDAIEPLTGFSHGAAGIGWALLRFAAATDARRYAEVGLGAFGYERRQYRAEFADWPDYRVPNGPEPAGTPATRPSGMHAWCHGAPGIALARAASTGYDDHPGIAADLDLALAAMLAGHPAVNHSLCHGQLGNLEALTVARRAGRTELAGEHRRLAAAALDSVERTGPACGTPDGIPTPGLLVGLAGVGHGLLRLGFADRVPSVLLLEPLPGAGR